MRRGDVWWAALPPPSGSEPGYRRPVLILQANSFNQSKIHTIIGAVITSNLRLAEAPGNVQLSKRQSGLPRESVVNVSQVVTFDRSFLSDRIGRIPPSKQQEVDNGLRLVLAL
ncbi:MAG: type II toxin-antitoxin system PemK/MazF family toxin [Nitrospira sp.]|nr:type II toxin-antitoxin system PemK/MazF family toxin [Nitrospira sp.]